MATKIIYTGKSQELFQEIIETQSYFSQVQLGSIIDGVALVYFSIEEQPEIYDEFILALLEVGMTANFQFFN